MPEVADLEDVHLQARQVDDALLAVAGVVAHAHDALRGVAACLIHGHGSL